MQLDGGRYLLGEEIGSGGTARVFRARDTALGVERAVKLVTLGPGPERESHRSRLRAEARAMAGIDHPNVLKVHDIGTEGDAEYIVMDLAVGGSLQDRIDEGPLPVAEATHHLVAILGALEAAHAAGIVHRDVKPGNVLLDEKRVAHLADFGIARVQLGETDDPTRTGAAMGSLPYMAPEQRVDPRAVTAAADLYASACTLYALLTAATPVDLYLAPGSSPRWEGIPEPVAQVIRRATRSHPDDRFPDAGSMRRALLGAMHRLGITEAAPPPPARRDRDPEHELYARPRPRPAIGSMWLVFVILVVALLVAGTSPFWLGLSSLEGVLRPLGPGPADPVPPVVGPATLNGVWRGSWDDNPGGSVLTLEGEPEALRGQLDLALGGHAIKATVEGRFDPIRQELVLVEPQGGRYVARWQRGGLLVGSYHGKAGREPIPFAFVHVEAPE